MVLGLFLPGEEEIEGIPKIIKIRKTIRKGDKKRMIGKYYEEDDVLTLGSGSKTKETIELTEDIRIDIDEEQNLVGLEIDGYKQKIEGKKDGKEKES